MSGMAKRAGRPDVDLFSGVRLPHRWCASAALSLVLVLLLLHPQPALASESPRFDVSYLWHASVEAVARYRERVGRILGPRAAKSLEIVRQGSQVGLVYRRRGDHAGAVRVARAHSKLLSARGLEAAAPVPSREDYRVVEHVEPDGQPSEERKQAVAKRKIERVKVSPKASLEAAVERHVKSLRRKGKIAADERTAWSVYDFTTGEKLVSINEDVPLQAASLIKPFIAAAFFEKVERGQLKYGPRSRRHMERMIQRSDNGATNWVARRVGGPRSVQRVLRSTQPGIYQQTRIVEYIPRGGRTYRNRASAHDYSRFLYALWNDNLAGARELKRLMALPGPDRIKTNVGPIPRNAKIYNKTGSTGHLCGDMGIVLLRDAKGRELPYTFVGVIEKRNRTPRYGTWIRSRSNVIRGVSDLVYRGIARRHGIRIDDA